MSITVLFRIIIILIEFKISFIIFFALIFNTFTLVPVNYMRNMMFLTTEIIKLFKI